MVLVCESLFLPISVTLVPNVITVLVIETHFLFIDAIKGTNNAVAEPNISFFEPVEWGHCIAEMRAKLCPYTISWNGWVPTRLIARNPSHKD